MDFWKGHMLLPAKVFHISLCNIILYGPWKQTDIWVMWHANNVEFYFPLCFRWHLMLRAKRGGFIYRGDLYIRAWELQSESRQRTHQHQRNLCISVSSFGHTSIACMVAKFCGFSSPFLLLLSSCNELLSVYQSG